MSSIKWNPRVKLILSDVDETVADLYVSAEKEMVSELTGLLVDGKSLFFITGQSFGSVNWRIVEEIPDYLRKHIIISHCSGAEVWGYDNEGKLLEKPFYSLYDTSLSEEQKVDWREIIQKLIEEFKLEVYPTMSVNEFNIKSGGNPLSIMLEDRGPQITFEVVNGHDLTRDDALKMEFEIPVINGAYDIRVPIAKRAEELLNNKNIPITPRLAGVFAVDFAIKGVSKETSVKYVLNDKEVLNHLGLDIIMLQKPESMEIWGDKFSAVRGGSDRHMCEAVDPKVRAIDFRQEDPKEFPKEFNIVLWDGNKHLHEGLLEYLQSKNI